MVVVGWVVGGGWGRMGRYDGAGWVTRVGEGWWVEGSRVVVGSEDEEKLVRFFFYIYT